MTLYHHIMSKNKIEFMMEYVTSDVVSCIMEETGISAAEAMKAFYNSEVFERLRDTETGLYRESGGYVYELYKTECKYGHLVQEEI
jgi:hypothetical protein